jgi:hypothetical protein
LALELVLVGPEFEDDPDDFVDPTVLLRFPDGPVALVPLLSRTTLLLTSQHWLLAVPLELRPVWVPCAFAKLTIVSNAAPHAAAKYTFFMAVSSLVAEESQCRHPLDVPCSEQEETSLDGLASEVRHFDSSRQGK